MDFSKAFWFIISLPYFWNAMAGSTMMAMFFGAIIYDGEVPYAKKGFYTIASYMFMVGLVMFTYFINRYPIVSVNNPGIAYQLFVYPLQIMFLSIFWLVGFFGSIFYFRWKKGKI